MLTMPNKELKRIMTELSAGHITKQEADRLMNPKKVTEEKPEDEIEGKEEIAPINSKKGKAQRDKARDKLLEESEEETQTRKLNPKGGKK